MAALGRSSIRAGYGIYYIFSRANAVRSIANMPPWFYRVARDASQLSRTGGTFSNPRGSDPDPFAGLVTGRTFPLQLGDIPLVEQNLSEPYQHQWTSRFSDSCAGT